MFISVRVIVSRVILYDLMHNYTVSCNAVVRM